MRFSLAAAAAILPVLSVMAEDHLILVGADNKLVFSPSNISAAAGDTVSFQFQNKNHSVTQSTFASPCAIQTTPAQGIDSGFQLVAANATQLPQWSFTVDNASSPLWFFCAQTTPASHCEAGMVFSVNAVESSPKNFAAYQAAAMAGNAAAGAGSAIASGAAAATSVAGGAIGAATSAAAGAAGAAGSVIASAAGAAATGAAGIASAAGAALTGFGGLLGGGASSTASAGNGTAAGNSGFRVGASSMSLVAAFGLAAVLL